MAGERERISIQEAVELTGISLPTIYRRINSGEIRGIICIDGRGKHWEIYKSEIPKLMLKRRRRREGFVTEELPAVSDPAPAAEGAAEQPSADSQAAVQAQPHPEPVIGAPAPAEAAMPAHAETAGLKSRIEALTEENIVCREQLRQLKERCQELQAEIEELREELDGQRDDAAYWRGRWEEASVNFETLRQAMVAKNDDDQEEIWSLRDQVNDLQEQVSLSEEALAAERELRESSSVLPAEPSEAEYGERHSIAPEPVFPDIAADGGDGEDAASAADVDEAGGADEDSDEADSEEYVEEDGASDEADGEEYDEDECVDSDGEEYDEEYEDSDGGEYDEEYEDSDGEEYDEECEDSDGEEYDEEYEDSDGGEYDEECEDSDEADGEEYDEEYEDSDGGEYDEEEYEDSDESDAEEYDEEESVDSDEAGGEECGEEDASEDSSAVSGESPASEADRETSRATNADLEAAADADAGGIVHPEPDFSVPLNAADSGSAAEKAAERQDADGGRSFMPEITDAPAPKSAYHTAEMPAAMHASGERRPAVRRSIPPIPRS